MRITLFLFGAAIGTGTRFAIVEYFKQSYRFPIGVLFVNVLGSFLFGVTHTSESGLGFALAGFCGALTTWSAFALDLHNQLRSKEASFALLNLLMNFGVGVAAAMFGIWVQG